jgi:hypothetical protein
MRLQKYGLLFLNFCFKDKCSKFIKFIKFIKYSIHAVDFTYYMILYNSF